MSRHRHISDKKIKYRQLLRVTAITLAVVIAVSVALLAIRNWENRQGEVPVATPVDNTVTYNGQKYRAKNVETMLVLGLDKFEEETRTDSYNNDQQADFLMLFVFDTKNSTCTALHINRDTMAEISVLGIAGEKLGTVNRQIALAHTYGSGGKVSCRNTVESVSGVLSGVDIDNYISITMDSVPVFNDLVGGVEVFIEEDFTGIDDTLVMGETVTLKGEQALTYVRSRHGVDDESNIARMERQRKYLQAFFTNAASCAEDDDTFVIDSLREVSEYIVSNCTIPELERFFERITNYDISDITYLDGEYRIQDNFMEFYPDKNSVDKTVMELFYEPVQ